jgi:hypothetical protein
MMTHYCFTFSWRALAGVWLMLVALLVSPSQVLGEDFTYQIRLAIFSNRQFFWPGIRGKEIPDEQGKQTPQGSIESRLRIGVLPLRILNYWESLPCDSCHRLSANGMEFYLENYLKDKLANRFPKAQIELIAPHFQLLENRKLDLLACLDSLDLPWAQWFDDFNLPLVYRPRDRITSVSARKRLDGLGGLLHQDYLLLPTQVDIKVRPLISNGHTGGLAWSFGLVFWNVAEGKVEWALRYKGEAGLMDLDKSLDTHLDLALGNAWDRLPSELQSLWKAEPH